MPRAQSPRRPTADDTQRELRKQALKDAQKKVAAICYDLGVGCPFGTMGKGRGRDFPGGLARSLLIVGNSEAFERKPKDRITVLKVGTVTPLLGV